MSLIFFEDFAAVQAIPENAAGSTINPGRIANSSAATDGAGFWQWNFTAISELYAGFAMSMPSNQSNKRWLEIFGDAGATQHLTIMPDGSNHIQVRRGTNSGTILATSAATMPVDGSARSMNVYATIADAGGRVVVKIDGVTFIDFTGDTKNGGTNNTIDRIQEQLCYMSDLVVCDGVDGTSIGQSAPFNTYPGDLNCMRLLPAANGNYTAFTPSTGTNHAALVDELPANTTDYNTSTAAGQKDSYTLSDPPSSAAILAVRETAYVAKTDAGAQGVKPFIREGGVDTLHATSYALSTSFVFYAGATRTKCPSTGVAWTVANVNGLEVGVESEAA